jgi:hypothetical protein
MYGLHPLMPIEHIVPIVGGNERDGASLKVLTNIIIKWEKLQEGRMQVVEHVFNSGIDHYGTNKRI